MSKEKVQLMQHAANKYGIPVSTLHDHTKGKVKRVGEQETNSFNTCRRGRDCVVLLEVARNWFRADKGDCISFIVINFLHARLFCKQSSWLGLVEWLLEEVAKVCFQEITAPVNQKATRTANSAAISGYYKKV